MYPVKEKGFLPSNDWVSTTIRMNHVDADKRDRKNQDGNCTRMQRAILNKSLKQRLMKQQQYGHLPPIPKTIQVRGIRHAGHCWRSKGELKSDNLQWTPTHGHASVGRSAKTYLQQLYGGQDAVWKTYWE